MFTWTSFDRLKYGLSRLSYGMATWRGFDARKLVAETEARGLTAVVIACRFAPGGIGPAVTTEWRDVSVTLGRATHRFHDGGRRKPYLVEVEPGSHRLRIEHNGPPPSYETTIDIGAGRVLLIEVLPATRRVWRHVSDARLRISSGDDHLVFEGEL